MHEEPNNYEATSLSIDVSKEKSMFNAFDFFGNLDIGLVALEYARKLKNCHTHTFDLSTSNKTVNDVSTENGKTEEKPIKTEEAEKLEEALEKDNISIEKNQFFKQSKGMRTCFIMSVLNALTETDKGVEHLKNFFLRK